MLFASSRPGTPTAKVSLSRSLSRSPTEGTRTRRQTLLPYGTAWAVCGAELLIYVVGFPQSEHFEMVFATARLAHWLPDDVQAAHVVSEMSFLN